MERAIHEGPRQFEGDETGLSDGIHIEVTSGRIEPERIQEPNATS